MSPEQLAASIRAMRPFLPARNFELSKRFYADIGFQVTPLGGDLAELRLGPHAFLLQDYFVQQWAENFVMHMMVDDVDAWWGYIASLDLAGRYGVPRPRVPRMESWGLKVAYLFDPSGVLWHIAEAPAR
jgi:hypothetical protein